MSTTETLLTDSHAAASKERAEIINNILVKKKAAKNKQVFSNRNLLFAAASRVDGQNSNFSAGMIA